MPRTDMIHTCTGCDEKYLTIKFAEFNTCNNCGDEVCVKCGRMYRGKVYCPDCKPVETNYYDRSVE